MTGHWQFEAWRVCAWFGITPRRFMFGVIVNFDDGLTIGGAIGPLYFGVGTV